MNEQEAGRIVTAYLWDRYQNAQAIIAELQAERRDFDFNFFRIVDKHNEARRWARKLYQENLELRNRVSQFERGIKLVQESGAVDEMEWGRALSEDEIGDLSSVMISWDGGPWYTKQVANNAI